MKTNAYERNKLILIADSTEEGWEVVNEYERRDPADDIDEDKRLRQAEARAYEKCRRARLQRKQLSSERSLYPGLSSVPFNSPAVVRSPGPFLQTPALSATPSQNTSSTIWPRSSLALRGSCFACGRFGHFGNQCSLRGVQPFS